MAVRLWRGMGGTAIGVTCMAMFAVMLTIAPWPRGWVGAEEAAPEEAPPAGQQYTGWKKCGACHFDQMMKWKKTGHAKAFDNLTAKYQKDAKCLKCHTTGYGDPSGYKDESSAGLAGVSCEVCHGPGSKHEEVAKPFANVKKLTPEQEKAVRGSIWKTMPKNVCLDCHKVQGHADSETPAELRKK